MPKFLPYLLLLLFTLGSALYRWKSLSQADRWICLLLFITIIQEWIAFVFREVFQNNYTTYHIYTPIEVGIICMYFDRSLFSNRKSSFGLYLFLISLALSITNTLFLQKITQINSYYLLYEGCLVITLCIYSFYRLLVKEDIIPKKMAHFWITNCFLFYWCLSYVNLGVFGYTVGHSPMIIKIFGWTLYSANILFYLGLAIVFIRYKKLIPSGE